MWMVKLRETDWYSVALFEHARIRETRQTETSVMHVLSKSIQWSLLSQCSGTALRSWSNLRTSFLCWWILSVKFFVSPMYVAAQTPQGRIYGVVRMTWQKQSCYWFLVSHQGSFISVQVGLIGCRMRPLISCRAWQRWCTLRLQLSVGIIV